MPHESLLHIAAAMHTEFKTKDHLVPQWSMIADIQTKPEEAPASNMQLAELDRSGLIPNKVLHDKGMKVDAVVCKTGARSTRKDCADIHFVIKEVELESVKVERKLDGEKLELTRGALITKWKVAEEVKQEAG